MSSFSPKRRLHDSHRLISFKEGSESVSSDQQNCIPRFQTPEASASNYGQQSPKQHAKCRISLRRANLIGAAAPHAQGHNEAVAGASPRSRLATVAVLHRGGQNPTETKAWDLPGRKLSKHTNAENHSGTDRQGQPTGSVHEANISLLLQFQCAWPGCSHGCCRSIGKPC